MEYVDNLISAELPTEAENPSLRRDILQYNMHKDSHLENTESRCNRNGKCIYNFPFAVNPITYLGNDGRVVYRRRKPEDGWVVSHIPFLVSALQCHIHADICSKAGVFMYMYKYIYKGPDQCSFAINTSDTANIDGTVQDFNEFVEYIRGRYLSSSEGAWRILQYNINTKIPSVKRITIQLPGMHYRQMFRKNNSQSEASMVLRYFHRPVGEDFDRLTISEYYELFDQKPFSDRSKYPPYIISYEIPSHNFPTMLVIKKANRGI